MTTTGGGNDVTANETTPEPNFFLIGAPRCGTTALSSYLEQHPQVLFSRPKEPHFFNTDHTVRYARTVDEYLACFSHGTGGETAVGEGSVFYLFSRDAVPNILARYPEAKFIAALRNPAEAAYSCHGQAVYLHGEFLTDFEEAWNAQFKRRTGDLPVPNKDFAEVFRYGDLYSYADQLKRLYSHVPRDRVKVVLYEDFARDPALVYSEVLRFLSLQPVSLDSYPRVNQGRQPRSAALERVVFQLGKAKRQLGVHRGFGLLSRTKNWNSSFDDRQPLAPAFRSELEDFFREDIVRTSAIIGRDLSDWLA